MYTDWYFGIDTPKLPAWFYHPHETVSRKELIVCVGLT